jgi:hypothetical protein
MSSCIPATEMAILKKRLANFLPVNLFSPHFQQLTGILVQQKAVRIQDSRCLTGLCVWHWLQLTISEIQTQLILMLVFGTMLIE